MHTAEVPVASSLDSGLSFRCPLSPGGGTGNAPWISLRPPLITEHRSVSSQSDPAREASPCSRYLRPARDVDTTCTVGANAHESRATKVRAHRAPNLLRGCVGRSHVDHTEARKEVRKPDTPSRQAKVRVEFLTWTDAPAGSVSVLFEEGRTIDRSRVWRSSG